MTELNRMMIGVLSWSRIEILQDDIDNGVPATSSRNPLALALARKFPGAIYVSALVGIASVYFDDSTVNVYQHDDARFSRQFNHQDHAEPGSVELALVKVVDHAEGGLSGFHWDGRETEETKEN